MALAAGIRLGSYEILAPLGAGGMGEVYRARDTKLGRDVALKFLPDVFARDAQRMARFRREAQVLASLNHPNIATIHGLEESDGKHALIMELVEGPTLADRIAQGPIPPNEALPIAKQIADGLEYAHERGIIHRDLKPANVKVRPDGTVKILDFGLAKALEETPAAGSINTSPTISAAATREGIILGTAAYMSPEQARGKTVDRRCDIWSFGALLFEMLSGRQAFAGEDVSQTLAVVIMKDPDWSVLPINMPVPVARLVRRCLTKDPRQRLRDIGEARIGIEEAIAHPEAALGMAAEPAAAQPARSRWQRALPWALATVLLVAAVAGLAAYFWLAPSPAPVLIADVSAPKGAQFVFLSAARPALSPDGRALVFSARDANNTTMLWVRRLDASSAQPLPGTEDPGMAFWSPDGRRIGFYAHHKLQVIEASGGQPVTLSDTLQTFAGGTWSRDGTILFGEPSEGIYKIPASGGAVAPVITRDTSRFSFCFAPKFLPDGKHFLYTAANPGSAGDVYYASLDGKENRLILQGGGAAIYSSGFLVYGRGGSLVAQPFDPERGQARGKAHRIAERVRQGSFYPYFDVSQNGVLVYPPTGPAASETQVAWFGRDGKRLGFVGVPAVYFDLRLSPDARRLAFSAGNPKSEIWAGDLVRGVRMRLTFDPDTDKGIPVWSPDGTQLLFSTLRGSKARVGIYRKASNGASGEELLLASDAPDREVWATDWSPDGRFVLLGRGDMLNNSIADIWVLPMTRERKPSLFLHAAAATYDGQFSPDGRWVAYTSRESGRPEVYVVPFDASRFLKGGGTDSSPGGKWQVSSDGGSVPRWRRDGREMFYLRPDNSMMAVEVAGKGSSFEVGRSQPLFTVPVSPFESTYDVAPDGKRFVLSFAPEEDNLPLTLVLNWPALLRED